ncbi:hypothetical protein DEU38_13429 [Rhodococcus sp. AG1013]|nr:hypothetical protein [Rhodococcus sp. AG1013]RDI13454.1 hypothetical protein DEU38_13429 [Rhodococcus sp. AG1013]
MREYVVEIGGLEHTVQLTDADAKERGAREKLKVATRARVPRNKAR